MQSTSLALPPLIEGHQVPFSQPPGETAQIGSYGILAVIAANLGLPGLDAHREELVSIPDVWAQVEVFRTALYDDRHPLHRRAVGEWRGLIATFALRAYREGVISTVRILLDDGVRNGADRRLIEILNRIRPTAALTPRHNWHEIGLIRAYEHVLGLLVPTTLVCPARRPPSALVGRLPWIFPDRIVDPLRVYEISRGDRPDISTDEIAVLGEFCRQAIYFLDNDEAAKAELGKQDPGLVGRLRQAFSSFQDDADRRGASATRGEYERRTLHLELPQQPFFPLLANALAIRRPRMLQTLLAVRPELTEAGIKGILLIDRDLPQALGTAASEITVWDNTSLQRVLDEPATFDVVKLAAAAEGYLCLRASELFTTHFYRTDKVQVEAQPGRFRDALLPVTPAVMMLMTPDELKSAIEIDVGHHQNIVTLRLRLANGSTGTYYALRKVYNDEVDIINREQPPTTLAFWPNFEHPDWHWHFAYYGGNLQQHFAPRMFVSSKTMAAFITADAGPAARVRRAEQLVREPHFLAEQLPLSQTSALAELYRSESAPEALYCDCVIDQRATGFVDSKARTPVGMLLLPAPKRSPANPVRCQIGIDFGTVNTAVYWKVGVSAKPERMVFRNRLVLPFELTDDTQRAAFQEFLPLADVDIPFMTVLRNRQIGPAAPELPLWGSHIYYLTEMDRSLRELAGDRLRFELKWANDSEERRPILTFLAQVALQSLAEAAATGISPNRVEWRFSYPEAYSPTQLGDFWSTARRAVAIAVSPKSESAAALDDPSLRAPEPTTDSESLATALYFVSEKSSEAPPTGNLVTIDMGGLTSDVSIWHRQRLIWRNSLKLAGRHIVIRYLYRNFELIRRIGQTDEKLAGLVRLVEMLPEDKRFNGIEMLLNNPDFSVAFVNNFALHGAEPVGRGLKVVAELALLGILHYVGRTMQHLNRHGIAGDGISQAQVAVCLGGRTSMLYGRLFAGDGRRSQLASSLGVFKDAAPGLIAGAREVYSDRPKHEAAWGLLVPQTGAREFAVDDEHRMTDVILGETMYADETQLPADATTAELLRSGGAWKTGNLTELRAFLASVEVHAHIGVELVPEAELRIQRTIEEHLADNRGELRRVADSGRMNDARLRRESTIIEPPFVIGLRELLAIIIEGDEGGIRVRTPD